MLLSNDDGDQDSEERENGSANDQNGNLKMTNGNPPPRWPINNQIKINPRQNIVNHNYRNRQNEPKNKKIKLDNSNAMKKILSYNT